MKHLRKFNEGLEPNEVEELKDFCESSLAYLLDEGYQVDVLQTGSLSSRFSFYSLLDFQVVIGLPGQEALEYFYWNDVKDYYIPFLQLLSRRYQLGTFSTNGSSGAVYFNGDKTTCCTLKDVINEDLPTVVHHGLWGINVKVKDKI